MISDTVLLIAVLTTVLAKQPRIAFDQWINCIIWSKVEGWGYADETLSARTWRLHLVSPATWGRFRALVDGLFFWQQDDAGRRNHCERAYRSEVARRHLPPGYRRPTAV